MLIPPKVLKGLVNAAATDAVRYQLTSVYLEREADSTTEHPSGRCHATATDGKILATATWREDDPQEYPTIAGVDPSAVPGFAAIVHRDSCREMAKLPPKRSPRPILENLAIEEKSANGTLRACGSDLDKTRQLEAQTVDGKYPDYRTVIPTGEPDAVVYLDPLRLEQACKTIRETLGLRPKDSADRTPTVRVEIRKNRPVSLTIARDDVELTTLVMPLTCDR